MKQLLIFSLLSMLCFSVYANCTACKSQSAWTSGSNPCPKTCCINGGAHNVTQSGSQPNIQCTIGSMCTPGKHEGACSSNCGC